MKKILFLATMALVSSAAFAQPKFAHVNMNEVVQLMPEMDQARATMAASNKEAQETYQMMVDEFNAKYQTYQQKSSTWTPAIRESKETELTEIQQRIQKFEQDIQMEMQQDQQKLMGPIYKKANDTLAQLAKDGGYIYVFDSSTILYIDPAQSTDLTPAARKALGIPDDRTLESLQAELQAQQQAQQQ